MSDLTQRIADRFPGVLPVEGVSLLKIHTTQPVVLCFGRDDAYPACVAQRGSREYVTSIQEVMGRLWRVDPALVAEPLGTVEDGSGQTWGVARGLPGWPWFALPVRYPGAAGLADVSRIAVTTLQRFRRAVAAYDDWQLAEPLPARLERQLHEVAGPCAEVATAIPADARQRWLSALAAVDCTRWHRQHGDFCLNNLLIEGTTASVVDFEEFGLAEVPLHDEFSLGFSLHEFAERSGVTADLSAALRQCVASNPLAVDLDDDALTALLIHHLCWRINQCASRPTRAAIAARLTEVLGSVVDGRLAVRPA